MEKLDDATLELQSWIIDIECVISASYITGNNFFGLSTCKYKSLGHDHEILSIEVFCLFLTQYKHLLAIFYGLLSLIHS